jgi:P27 family predicted phage terminase small subunit
VGRKPTPTNLKLLRNNPGKRSINQKEPKPDGVPECPGELSNDARKEWERIAPILLRMGLLTNADRAALAGYCSLYAEFIQAELAIRELGATFTTPNGHVQVRPEVSIRKHALAGLTPYLARFGLSPSDRAGMETTEPAVGPRQTMDQILS